MILHPQKWKTKYILKIDKKIPIYKIYHLVDGDFVVYLKDLFAPNFFRVKFYNSNGGARRFSILFPSIFMLFVWVYMHQYKIKLETFIFCVYFAMLLFNSLK